MEDFSKIIKDHCKKYQLKFRQNPQNTFQHPFRALFVGGSGSGKTSLLLSCLLRPEHKVNFDRIFIFARDIEEPAYQFLKDKLQEVEDYLKENFDLPEDFFLFKFSNDINEIPDPATLEASHQNLMIIDDMVNEKNQDMLKVHFTLGRKRNCSYIYLTQSYFATPKIVRLNCDYFCIFNLNSKREISLITSEFCSDIEPEDFKAVYNAAVAEPYHFLLIDTSAKRDLSKKYRCLFDNYSDFGDQNNRQIQ